jgi:hypothetical protein
LVVALPDLYIGAKQAHKGERCVDLVLDHAGTAQQRKDGTADAPGG